VTPLVRAVVLAAGASRRFGTDKLLAELQGHPLLQHVLDRVAEAGLVDPIVVVGPDHQRFGGRITWRGARPVVNPRPADGLASSVRIGWDAALTAAPMPAAILFVLGDQPLVRPDVIRVLLGAPLDPARPVVAPRYGGGGGPNPLRVEATAAELVALTHGDRGLGPILDARPELVRRIEVEGDNPDVDEPADLARLVSRPP
jgi:molybdenum cofactor cytidylyltransferase